MRRKQQEITSKSEIEAVLEKARICYLGLSENDQPYVVPVNFGYKDDALYFHSACAGRKIEIIRKNPSVSFTIVSDYKVILGAAGCNSTTDYHCVMGTGKASILTEDQEKIEGLNIIMTNQGWDITAHPIDYSKKINGVLVVKILIGEMTGKRSPA